MDFILKINQRITYMSNDTKKECNCVEKSCTNTCTKNHTCHVFWCEKCVDYGAGGASRFANKDGGLGGGGSSCAEPFVPSKNPMEECGHGLDEICDICDMTPNIKKEYLSHQSPQEEEFEDTLREIIYSNWKKGDEVGLYVAVRSLLSSKVQQAYEQGNKDTCLRCGKAKTQIHTCKLAEQHKERVQQAVAKEVMHSTKMMSIWQEQSYQSGEKAMLEKVLGEIDLIKEIIKKEYVGTGQWVGNWQNTPLVNEEDVYQALDSLKERLLINK